MQHRQRHRQEVQRFLEQRFSNGTWDLTIPEGSGHETYIARGSGHSCFVKLGALSTRYEIAASIGLTPPVLVADTLRDGTSILVQPYISGKKPSRRDYHLRLEEFASAIKQFHQSSELKQVLPEASSTSYSAVGLAALERIRQKWERHKPQVPEVANFIDQSLDGLRRQITEFQGTGVVASHNDLCNANWLISTDGQLHLIDLDSMSLEDPALDVGATLWWYYPPRLRNRFLTVAGYSPDKLFGKRMQVRMAIHCLNIRLPREQSFDVFDPTSFAESLTDFKAILAGRENPQGYED